MREVKAMQETLTSQLDLLDKNQIKSILQDRGHELSARRIAAEMRLGEYYISNRRLLVNRSRVEQILIRLITPEAITCPSSSRNQTSSRAGRRSGMLQAG